MSEKITVYWWNFGKKTLDFKGTCEDFFEQKGITVEEGIPHRLQRDVKGRRFMVYIGSSVVTLDSFNMDYKQGCIDIIKIFLTLLGDRALLITPRRTYPINK